MIKLRAYFVDDKKGNIELEEALKKINKEFNVIVKYIKIQGAVSTQEYIWT